MMTPLAAVEIVSSGVHQKHGRDDDNRGFGNADPFSFGAWAILLSEDSAK